MATRAHSTPASALLRAVPRSLWPEAVRERQRRLARGLRRLEDLREEMVVKLDELTGDPDLEPSLGAPEHASHLRLPASHVAYEWARGCADDREGDGDGLSCRGDDSDYEPSLGAPDWTLSGGGRDQRRWALGGAHDLELATEDDERSLGWCEAEAARGRLGIGMDELEDAGEAEPELPI